MIWQSLNQLLLQVPKMAKSKKKRGTNDLPDPPAPPPRCSLFCCWWWLFPLFCPLEGWLLLEWLLLGVGALVVKLASETGGKWGSPSPPKWLRCEFRAKRDPADGTLPPPPPPPPTLLLLLWFRGLFGERREVLEELQALPVELVLLKLLPLLLAEEVLLLLLRLGVAGLLVEGAKVWFNRGWNREEKLLGRRTPAPMPGDMRGKSSLIRAKLSAEVIGKRKNCWRMTTSSSRGGIVHLDKRPPRGSCKKQGGESSRISC